MGGNGAFVDGGGVRSGRSLGRPVHAAGRALGHGRMVRVAGANGAHRGGCAVVAGRRVHAGTAALLEAVRSFHLARRLQHDLDAISTLVIDAAAAHLFREVI